MLGRILCTCTAANLPLRSFLGRSCKSVYRGAPGNYFCSISFGRTDCLGAPNNYFAAFPLEEHIVYAWPLCASLPATKHIKLLPRPLQFEVFCFRIASHGALGRHFSEMITAGWSHGTPNEDFGCITSHEQSTRCSFYSGMLAGLNR